MKLYDLIPAYQGIMEQIESAEQDQMQMLIDTLEAINASLEVKADGYARMITMLERHAEAMSAEQDRLAALTKTTQNKARYMRERLQMALEAMEKPEVRTDLFTIRLRNNPPSVDVRDPAAIPDEYQRKTIKIDPDKTKIKAALMDGKEVPGAALMQGRRLEIK